MAMSPTEFEHCVNEKLYSRIYDATSQQFKQIIPLNEFQQLVGEFCADCKQFRIAFHNQFLQGMNYVWLNERKDKAVFVAFDREDRIQGLYVKPFITYPHSDKRLTKNKYQMPFIGEWFVFWGGTNEFQNYHYIYENQRYAYDFVKWNGHATYKDTVTRNENYFAFSEQVVTPCDGTVVAVADGYADNIPGEMDEAHPAGNYVIIAHPHNEYSLLAHFEQNSIIVNVGDKVVAGQPVGRCGNSGNSSEPHIHFQVMDQANFEQAKSLHIRFHHKEPVQGDTVTSTQYLETPKKQMDMWDKVETTLSISDIILFIPRIIGQFFK